METEGFDLFPVSPEEAAILKEIEELAQKLGSQFDPIKKHLIQTEIALTATEFNTNKTNSKTTHTNFLYLTPQDTLSDAPQNNNATPETEGQIQRTIREEEEPRYEFRKLLGEGGMGTVSLVYDRLLGREVALKTLKLNTSSEKMRLLLWRLNQEASITAILEHPHIVPLYEMQQKSSGEIQFTMRKIEGKTLRLILVQMRQGEMEYNENRLLSIFLKICDAVAYAHTKKIVHRDLKPENIMVGDFGEVYVMDWGIAKRISDPLDNEKKTKKDTIIATPLHFFKTIGGIGTPGYMSPEQIGDGNNATPLSDIYALGKILRECFMLVSPLEELREKIAQKSSKMPEMGREHFVSREIPKDILAIVSKALEENPKDRYESAQAFAQDVENYLRHSRVSVREYALWELFEKWIRRHRKYLIASISTLCLSAILIFYVQWLQKQQVLKQHQQRLDYWLTELRDPKPGMREQALLEINKMKEPEIFERLLSLLQEGTHYYLTVSPRLPKQEEYYRTIVTALGWLENPSAGPYLLDSLEKFRQKFAPIPKEKRPIEEENYMVILAEALAHCKAHQASLTLYHLRDQMGRYSIFWNRTDFAFQQLFMLDGYDKAPENIPCVSDRDYLIRGMLRYEGNEVRGAREDFEQATQKNPKNFTAWNNLAMMKRLEGDLEGAVQDLSRAVQLNPQYSDAYLNRGLAQQELGRFEQALNDYDHALKINSRYVEAYNNRGNLFLELQRFEEAIADYSQAIQYNANNADTYYNRSRARKELHLIDLALEDCRKAIQLNPDSPFHYNFSGLLKQAKKDWNGALNDYNEALKRDPNYVDAYNNRGSTKYEMNDIDGALVDLSEALRLNSKFAKAWYNCGLVYMQQKKFDQSLQHFNEAIRLTQNDPYFYNNRGVLKYKMKIFEQALTDFTEAIRLSPNFGDAYNNRGLVKKNIGDLEGALDDFAKAQQFFPSDYSFYHNRGNIYFDQERFEEAILEYNQAIKNYPASAESYFSRGKSYHELEKYEEAHQDYTQTIRLNPAYVHAYYRRGQVQTALNKQDEAIKDYSEVIRQAPSYADAYQNRGNLYYQQDKIHLAVQDLAQAYSLKETLVQNEEFTAQFSKLVLQCATEHYRKKDFATTKNDLELFLKLFPQHPDLEKIQKMLQKVK